MYQRHKLTLTGKNYRLGISAVLLYQQAWHQAASPTISTIAAISPGLFIMITSSMPSRNDAPIRQNTSKRKDSHRHFFLVVPYGNVPAVLIRMVPTLHSPQPLVRHVRRTANLLGEPRR